MLFTCKNLKFWIPMFSSLTLTLIGSLARKTCLTEQDCLYTVLDNACTGAIIPNTGKLVHLFKSSRNSALSFIMLFIKINPMLANSTKLFFSTVTVLLESYEEKLKQLTCWNYWWWNRWWNRWRHET